VSRYLKAAMSAACVALATFTVSASASAAVFPARHLAGAQGAGGTCPACSHRQVEAGLLAARLRELLSASRTAYIRTPRPRWFLVKPRGHAYANVAWKLCGSGGANGSGGEWTGGVVFTAPLDTRQVTLDEANYQQVYGRVCSFNFVATALRVHQA
jgi:hypothetical protein